MLLTEGAELARLDFHFRRVLSGLHARDLGGLSRVQRRARATHLARLDAYRRRRVFPKNRRFPGRMLPHFIDESGTRCAMGQLIEASGGRDLVQYIARERNFARIRELATIPELVAWLEANGLTAEEAARIQPTYCGTPAHNCVCADSFYQGMISGTLVDGGAGLHVDAVFGPVQGVDVGEVVPLSDPSGLAGASDVVFATVSTDGTAHAKFAATSSDGAEPLVDVPVSACWFPQVASIPGPLPLDTVTQALSAPDVAACEQVLAQYDAAWGTMQGDCQGSGGVGGSGGGGTGGSSGTAGRTGSGGVSGASDGGPATRVEPTGGCGVARQETLGAEAVIALSATVILAARRRRR